MANVFSHPIVCSIAEHYSSAEKCYVFRISFNSILKSFHGEKPLRPMLPSPIKPSTTAKYGTKSTIETIISHTGG